MLGLWKKQYTLRRYSKQKVKKGVASAGFTDKVVTLNVQPIKSGGLMTMPEGDRNVTRIKSFGNFPIMTADQSIGQKADKLFFQGAWYECTTSLFWEHTPLSHYESEFVIVPEPSMSETPPTNDETGKGNEPAEEEGGEA